ncbi:MAG TPA: S41 family peptidase [Pyrinomonadaceae bacterium]|jgi:carboxyl-terminal processing protease|nr:S41 family peptidase [Pyrinomonadaceae bacterium]
MRISSRVSLLLVSLSVATCANFAQLKSPLNDTVEPFSIRRGSSFTASGGSTGVGSSRPSSIAADIAEVEAIIRANSVEGKQLDSNEMTKLALDGALRALDPHSSYFDAREWQDMLDEEQSGYTGIGATIANFESGGVSDTYVLATAPGSPAARAQLKFGDRIVAINGEKMSGRDTDIVRDQIRGAVGSVFRLTVERAATKRMETIEVRRGRVAQPSIPDAYILRPGVGYIELSEGFNYTTSDEMDVALRELKKQGMRALILDLRGNPGGIVDQAVKVAEKFLPSGTLILTQRGRSSIDNRVWKSGNSNPETMPLVVLVNEDTASASEIVAGAFQDNDRAMIVGGRTFGKGLVQSVIDLPQRTGLTLTTARYLTPSGRSIQRDYSKLDYRDYYDHKSVVSDIDRPYFEARTVTNRRVYGGDGIQPDETVKDSRLTNDQARLLDPIFFFTREIANGRTPRSSVFQPAAFAKGWFAESILVDDKLVASFESYVTSTTGEKLSAEALRANADFIKLRLRYELAIAARGLNAGDQVLLQDDPQAAKAVSMLPQAAQLARLAEGIRNK